MKVVKLYNKLINTSVYYSLLLALTQSITALFLLFIDFYFSKGLTVHEFGVWKKLIFYINFLIPIISLGIPEGYKYYLAKNKKENNPLLSKTISLYFLITLVLILLTLFINTADYFGLINLHDYYIVSFLIPLAYLSVTLNRTLRYYYINYSRIITHTRVTLAGFAISSTILGLSWLFFEEIKSFYLYIGVTLYILLFFTPVISLISKLKHKIVFNKPDKDYIYKVLKQGIPLYLATFIGTLTLNLDYLIVNYFEDTTTFAVFSVGALEVPIFAMLSAAFSQRVYPELVRLISDDKKEDAKKLWIKTTIQVSYFTYPLIILLMFFAETIIFAIYSPKYYDAVFLFKTYLLVAIFRNNYYGALITASGKTKYITFYALIMLAANLIASCFLYYFLGIKGVVFGTLIATITIQFLQLRHENLVLSYIQDVLLNYRILFLIILIILTYLMT